MMLNSYLVQFRSQKLKQNESFSLIGTGMLLDALADDTDCKKLIIQLNFIPFCAAVMIKMFFFC